MRGTYIYILLWSLAMIGCTRQYAVESYQPESVQISDSLDKSPAVSALINPYKEKMETEMGEVLVHSDMQIEKGRPESLLGNFLSQLILDKCREYTGRPVDFGIVNYGGIRIPSLPTGPITKGKIYELMPFDNFLVVMTISGAAVKQLADHIASVEGWPVAGIRFEIKGQKAIEITIAGQPLDETATYTMAITDYLADGGDKLTFLVDKDRTATGVFMRDAIIEYLQELSDAGKSITSQLDERIKHAE